MATPIRKSKSIEVDFSGVDSGGGRKVPDGEYLLKVAEVESKESSSGNPMLVFKYKVANGPFSGATIWDNVSLTPQALWRFRTLLECFGMNPGDGKFKVDPDKYIGKTVFVQVANETYQGKEKPRISEFISGGAASESTTTSTGSGSKQTSIRVNDEVSFTSEGDTYSGKVLAVSGNTARVEVNGDEWEIETAELTVIPA